MDPWTTGILCVGAIAWSMWGVTMAMELLPDSPTWKWRAFLIAAAGPAIWGCAAYWGLRLLRRHILHRLNLPCRGCCGHHP